MKSLSDVKRARTRLMAHAFLAFFSAAALAAASPAAAALSVQFEVQPKIISIGETATMSFTVRGVKDSEKPEIPEVKGLRVMYSGTSQSISIVNGKMDRSVVFTYHILPTATGDFTIGPFTYEAGQEKTEIPAVTIRVAPAGPGGSGKQETMEDLLFARMDLESEEVYNQQVFDITLSIYSRGLNLGRETGLMNMETTGLTILPFEDMGSGREEVKGNVYTVRRFRGRAQALSAGTFTLEPVVRASVLVNNQGRRGRSFFDSSFFGMSEAREVDLRPPPLTVTVRALPENGKPAGFSGAVGTFSFKASVRPTEVAEGEPVTVTMDIRGKGNVESLAPPSIRHGQDFKYYEPKLISKEISQDRSEGHLVFEQVLIPRSTEAAPIAPVTFIYFDPEMKSYRTLENGPFPLSITPSANRSALVVANQETGNTPKTYVLGSDIVYLKAAPSAWKTASRLHWYAAPWFLALQAVPLVVLASLLVAARRRDQLSRDVARARRQKAPKAARAGMKSAEKALRENDDVRFYEALWETLSSYFAHRLNLLPGEISADVVTGKLASGGFDGGQVEQIREIFHLAEKVRFGVSTAGGASSPLDKTSEKREILQRMGRLLKACEKVDL